MNTEQVLEEIKELVASFEEEKEKAEREIEKVKAQIAVGKGQELNDLYCNLYWEKSRKSTLETVIFHLKMALENYHSN